MARRARSSAVVRALRVSLALLALWIGASPAHSQDVAPRKALLGRVEEMEEEEGAQLATPGHAAAQGASLAEVVQRIAGPQRSIIVVCVAENYVDMARNWAASVQRLGYGERILFIADDAAAHAALLALWPQQTVFPRDGGPALQGTTEQSGFGTPFFKTVVWQKPFHIRKLLDLNVTVFYNDVDMVWVSDPYPHLQAGDFDAVMQRDSVPKRGMTRVLELSKRGVPVAWSAEDFPCTCGMLFRPTAGAKKLVDLWQGGLALGTHDQKGFEHIVGKAAAAGVKLGMLPETLFPSGCLFFQPTPDCVAVHTEHEQAQRDTNSSAVVVHANWIVGHKRKVQRLKDAGLWRPEEAKGDAPGM